MIRRAGKQKSKLGRYLELEALKERLENRKTASAVVGLGYVGLPLALEIASAGFHVIGIDLDRNKVASLKKGQSYILDVGDDALAEALERGRFAPTSDFRLLRDVDTEHLRAYAAEQEPRPGYFLYFGGDGKFESIFTAISSLSLKARLSWHNG